jgi:hypothetical protein
MMIQLTHPEPNYDFWIDPSEIVVMERYNKPASILITMNADRPDVTALVLKSGKIMSCKETPSQIIDIVNEVMALVKGNTQ